MDLGWGDDERDLAAGAPLGLPGYHRVCDAIRFDIARGVLRSGERLKLAELTRRYGLSPAPIREALSQLGAEGWVVNAPNRGASVRVIDEAMLRDFNEVRVALESYIARLAADRATPADTDRLAAIQDDYEAAVALGRQQPLITINARFHSAIHAIHGGQEAAAIIRRQGRFFNAMRGAWGYQPGRPQQIAQEHRALIAAFRANDGATAERISRLHIGHALDDLLAQWRARATP